MTYVKNISFYLVISAIITSFSIFCEADFLFEYLQDNIIGLQITLLAINTATVGLVATKIQDVVLQQPHLNFSSVIKEMKISLREQIILISLSIIVLILCDSSKIEFINKDIVCDSILVGVLVYSLDILWDTGKSVFVIIELIQKTKN